MTPREIERRLRLLEASQIQVVGARCRYCNNGVQQELVTFLNRHDGDTFESVCRNAVLCRELRAHADG